MNLTQVTGIQRIGEGNADVPDWFAVLVLIAAVLIVVACRFHFQIYYQIRETERMLDEREEAECPGTYGIHHDTDIERQ